MDLAGIERIKNSYVSDKAMKESVAIKKSNFSLQSQQIVVNQINYLLSIDDKKNKFFEKEFSYSIIRIIIILWSPVTLYHLVRKNLLLSRTMQQEFMV